jgi:glycosyltransferase involved in cell wall biosynthesis
MRVGLMLRHVGRQPGGTGTYTNRMVDRILTTDHSNQYLLLYDDPGRLGSYAANPHVTELAVRSPSKLLWDQVVVPWIARRHRLDVIFNLKTSVPLLAPCPVMYVQHGADWFVVPEQYPLSDRLYVKLFAPLYMWRADLIVSVSEDASRRLAKLIGAKNAAKLVTIPHGVDSRFSALPDVSALARLQERYGLRAPFVLYLGQIYPMKNVGRLIRAFAQVRDRVPHQLVLVGKPGFGSSPDLALIEELGLGDRVRCIGWVPDQDVPLFYQAADLFVFPSLYEGFGITIIEAMAARCPVVTSTAGACPEVAGNAAILVDPLDVGAIADSIIRGLTDSQLRARLRERGSARAQCFNWDVSARNTIKALHSLVAGAPGARAPNREIEGDQVSVQGPPPIDTRVRRPTSREPS